MAKRVINLLGDIMIDEDRKAAEAILPGHLVGINSSGDLVKQVTASVAAARNFALDRPEMGKDIDTPYAINDTVKVGRFKQGDRVLAWLASGQNVAIGAMLESAGAGLLKVFGTGVVLGQATEAVNATAAAARITVQIV